MPYTGPALDVPRFFADLPPTAAAAGFAIEKFGEAAGWPLLALRRAAAKADAPVIYLSAGIHGDEPAGPLALRRLLKEKFFATHCHWLICPALNPGGLAAKTRENPANVDLNRDYREPQSPEAKQHRAFLQREQVGANPRFVLSILLHEDWETQGYYMYELNRTAQPLLGPKVLAAVEPICGVDHSPVIEGMEATHGLITRPVTNFEERPLWPESLWLVLKHTDRSMTLEAPSAQDLERRVAAHCAAVRTAIAALGI
jgi:protein MpaA